MKRGVSGMFPQLSFDLALHYASSSLPRRNSPSGRVEISFAPRQRALAMAPKAEKKTVTAMAKAWESEVRDTPMSRGRSSDSGDLATKVRKAISDNLKDVLTEAEIYGTVINGRTCYQQVLVDKE
eukprot:426867-Amphidinium_carterae.2